MSSHCTVYAALLPIINELNRWVPSGMVWFFHPGNDFLWWWELNQWNKPVFWVHVITPPESLPTPLCRVWFMMAEAAAQSWKGKVKHLPWACNSTPEGPRSMESCRMHAAWEHSTMPWSVGGHRTKSIWAHYKAGLWKEAAQPSSHMQGSGSGKDPGPGTQTQAALLEEQLKSQLPSTWFTGHLRP